MRALSEPLAAEIGRYRRFLSISFAVRITSAGLFFIFQAYARAKRLSAVTAVVCNGSVERGRSGARTGERKRRRNFSLSVSFYFYFFHRVILSELLSASRTTIAARKRFPREKIKEKTRRGPPLFIRPERTR